MAKIYSSSSNDVIIKKNWDPPKKQNDRFKINSLLNTIFSAS
jgi:hypothetical protein